MGFVAARWGHLVHSRLSGNSRGPWTALGFGSRNVGDEAISVRPRNIHVHEHADNVVDGRRDEFEDGVVGVLHLRLEGGRPRKLEGTGVGAVLVHDVNGFSGRADGEAVALVGRPERIGEDRGAGRKGTVLVYRHFSGRLIVDIMQYICDKLEWRFVGFSTLNLVYVVNSGIRLLVSRHGRKD